MKIFQLNKKGEAEAVVFAVCAMMVLMLICGFLDTLNILRKINAISQTITYVSRIGSNQGGFESTKPEFVSGIYLTSDAMAEHIDKTMNYVGIKDSEYDVVITNGMGNIYSLKDADDIKTVDRASTMNIKMSVDYQWNLLNNWLPLGTYTLETERDMWTIMKIRNGLSEEIPIQMEY